MIPATSRVVARAYAKVNLDLRVLGTRTDGFHELPRCFRRSRCTTRSSVPGGRGRSITCRVPGVPVDESNLVWKAAARLWDALGRSGPPADAAIVLEKVIPLQAGLGGGSADAAAALRALSRLWGGAPLPLLREVAAGLGADVPFFLSGGTALGLGRGEEIYPLVDLPSPTPSSSSGRRSACRPPRPIPRTTRTRRRACGSQGSCRCCPGPVAHPGGTDDQRSRAAGRSGGIRGSSCSGKPSGKGEPSRPRCRAAGHPCSAFTGAGW